MLCSWCHTLGYVIELYNTETSNFGSIRPCRPSWSHLPLLGPYHSNPFLSMHLFFFLKYCNCTCLHYFVCRLVPCTHQPLCKSCNLCPFYTFPLAHKASRLCLLYSVEKAVAIHFYSIYAPLDFISIYKVIPQPPKLQEKKLPSLSLQLKPTRPSNILINLIFSRCNLMTMFL